MKKGFAIFLFLICFYTAMAQRKKIDSLEDLLATANGDTNSVKLLRNIAYLCFNDNLDSALYYTDKEYNLADKIGYTYGKAKCLQDLGAIFEGKGNFPRALTNLLNALKQQELLKNTEGIASVLIQICDFYLEQDDPARMLTYGKKAYEISKPLHDIYFISAALTMGYTYSELNNPDSALTYFVEGYQASLQIIVGDKYSLGNKNFYLAHSFDGLAIVNGLLDNYNIALPYYYKSISYFIKNNYQNDLSNTYRYLSRMFKKKGELDSSFYYANQAIHAAYAANNSKQKLESYKLLAKLYEGVDDHASVAYFNKMDALTDSIHSLSQNREVENLNFDEQERQRQLIEEAKREEQERKENLQLSGIAVFIPLFLITLLLLSRTKTHRRVIEFMSVLSLLLVFEFITLLIHPWIERLTNRTPVLELLILVVLAAILVPLHHNLATWAKRKLVKSKIIPNIVIVKDEDVSN